MRFTVIQRSPMNFAGQLGTLRMPDDCPNPDNPDCEIIGGGGPTITRGPAPAWLVGFWDWTGGNRRLIFNAEGYVSLINNGVTSYGEYGNGLLLVDGNISTVTQTSGGMQTYNRTSGETSNYVAHVPGTTPTQTGPVPIPTPITIPRGQGGYTDTFTLINVCKNACTASGRDYNSWSNMTCFCQDREPGKPAGTACTMEAKVCPDGSSVGRSGPNCEFAACPDPASPGAAIPAVGMIDGTTAMYIGGGALVLIALLALTGGKS